MQEPVYYSYQKNGGEAHEMIVYFGLLTVVLFIDYLEGHSWASLYLMVRMGYFVGIV